MRFRSVRVQRLPLFDEMIVIFKKELDTIDVFGALRPVSDVFEREHHRIGIFSKSMKPSQHLVVRFRSMRTQIFKVLGSLSLCRHRTEVGNG